MLCGKVRNSFLPHQRDKKPREPRPAPCSPEKAIPWIFFTNSLKLWRFFIKTPPHRLTFLNLKLTKKWIPSCNRQCGIVNRLLIKAPPSSHPTSIACNQPNPHITCLSSYASHCLGSPDIAKQNPDPLLEAPKRCNLSLFRGKSDRHNHSRLAFRSAINASPFARFSSSVSPKLNH